MSNPVPPKWIGNPVILDMMLGNTAMNAKNRAPANVIRVITLSRYSAVGLPGLNPGMNPPYFLRLFAISIG